MSKFASKPKPPPMPTFVPPPVVKKTEPKVVEAKDETRKSKKRTKTKLTGSSGVNRQANVFRQTLGGAGESTLG
jgi:hypothetical protein